MNLPLIDASCCPALDSGVLSEDEADALAATLKVLADPVRLRLVSMLVATGSGEICACDLPAALGRSQSTVSHHLTQLVNAGVLSREQRGKWAWFRLQPHRLAEIAAALARTPSPGRLRAPADNAAPESSRATAGLSPNRQ